MISLLLACTPEHDIRALVPVLGVAPAEVVFGDVVVPTEASSQVFVTNGGEASLTVDATVTGDGFGLAPASLEVAPDESATLTVGFVPASYLDYAGELRITSNDPDAAEVVVPLTGTGVYAPLPDIAVDPTYDFGVVPAGSEVTGLVEVRNEGDADLHVDAVVQTGSGAFSVLGGATPFSLSSGESQLLGVVYTPSTDAGDHGTLTLSSDDPDEPVVEVLVLGNGGGDLAYPEAVIDCPAILSPPQFLPLDGSGSFDPSGLAITSWLWTLAVAPPDSKGYLTQQVLPSTELWADLAGDYVVSLVVQNEEGLASAPTLCALGGIPADALHVELTWDSLTTDLDLHVATDAAGLFAEPEDCYFCNESPDWGPGGLEDDARLDLDALGNGGPENVNVEEPADSTYVVRVHYFGDSGIRPPATAHVRVWLDGDNAFDGTAVLEHDDVWEVGQINWPEATFGVYPVAMVEADRGLIDCD